jgi:hypothetical protein
MADSSRNRKSGRGQRRSQAKQGCLKGQTMNSRSRGQNRQSGQCRNVNQQQDGGEQNRLLDSEEGDSRKRKPAPLLMITG